MGAEGKDCHPMHSMLPKQRVWRRSDRAPNLARDSATFMRETASRFAWWYGLGLLLQGDRQPSRPRLRGDNKYGGLWVNSEYLYKGRKPHKSIGETTNGN